MQLKKHTLLDTCQHIQPEKIGFDFDGVVADTAEAFLRLACEKHNFCSFSLEDITSFQVEDCINMPVNVVEDIFQAILLDSLATDLQPMAGAVEVINDLSHTAVVTIITARPLHQPVMNWLEVHFSPHACEQINLVAMGDHDDKARYIHQHKLSHFVDDRTETCMQLAREDITPLVFSQPWNRGQHTFHSVTDWQELGGMIK